MIDVKNRETNEIKKTSIKPAVCSGSVVAAAVAAAAVVAAAGSVC